METEYALSLGTHRWPLPADATEITIGRASNADVRLPADDQISRIHARLVRTPAGWTLHDASRNGTGLNSRRLTTPTPLSNADQIHIGPARLTFHATPAPAPHASTPHTPPGSPSPGSYTNPTGAAAGASGAPGYPAPPAAPTSSRPLGDPTATPAPPTSSGSPTPPAGSYTNATPTPPAAEAPSQPLGDPARPAAPTSSSSTPGARSTPPGTPTAPHPNAPNAATPPPGSAAAHPPASPAATPPSAPSATNPRPTSSAAHPAPTSAAGDPPPASSAAHPAPTSSAGDPPPASSAEYPPPTSPAGNPPPTSAAPYPPAASDSAAAASAPATPPAASTPRPPQTGEEQESTGTSGHEQAATPQTPAGTTGAASDWDDLPADRPRWSSDTDSGLLTPSSTTPPPPAPPRPLTPRPAPGATQSANPEGASDAATPRIAHPPYETEAPAHPDSPDQSRQAPQPADQPRRTDPYPADRASISQPSSTDGASWPGYPSADYLESARSPWSSGERAQIIQPEDAWPDPAHPADSPRSDRRTRAPRDTSDRRAPADRRTREAREATPAPTERAATPDRRTGDSTEVGQVRLARVLAIAGAMLAVGLLINVIATFLADGPGGLLRWLVAPTLALLGGMTFAVLDAVSPSERPASRLDVSVTIAIAAVLLGVGVGGFAVTAGAEYAAGYLTGNESGEDRLVKPVSKTTAGLTITVSNVTNTSHFTRIELTVTNKSPDAVSLPLEGNAAFTSAEGTTIRADASRSNWPGTFPAGQSAEGAIVFKGHLPRGVKTATLTLRSGDNPITVSLPLSN